MFERTVKTTWLLATLLAASPLLVQAAQDDPFAGPGEGEAAREQAPDPESAPPAGAGDSASDPGSPAGSGSSTDSAGAADAAAAEPGEQSAAESGSTSFEDEYGFDPVAEFSSSEDTEIQDPWEGFNRAIFRFNETADSWVLKPVATTYRQVTPIFMQRGVSNFFGNLLEVTNSFNSALQWKWGEAGNGAGRFLVNSTVGVAGLFDVAEHMGLEPTEGEDFDQTMAVWGLPSGPYLVLPFWGPATVREVPGIAVDWYLDPVTYIDHSPTRYSFRSLDLTQNRASLLKTESVLQGDRYALLRDAYLQRREYLINDGNMEDDFGVDDDLFGGGMDGDSGDPFSGDESPSGDDPRAGGSEAAADSDPFAGPGTASDTGSDESGENATEDNIDNNIDNNDQQDGGEPASEGDIFDR